MTKEELQNKVAVLEKDNRRLGEQEKELRKDISKVLGNYTYINKQYSHSVEKELIVYSWAQIFAELGKLLAAKTFYDLRDTVQRLDEHAEQVDRSIDKLFNKDNKDLQ